MSYLIRIYSPENTLVLDPFCGSGSTGVACMKENRKFVGIDLDDNYIKIANRRLSESDVNLLHFM